MRKVQKPLQPKVFNKVFFAALRFSVLLLIFVFPVFAQKIAILTPDKLTESRTFAAELEKSLARNYKILDAALSETAFRSAVYENAFNLSTDEARNVGVAIGCNYFLLVKSENLRRASLEKDEYYEAYAVVYAVSSRTGNLVFWSLKKFEADTPSEAEKRLFDSVNSLTRELSQSLETAKAKETASDNRSIEEPPPETKNFRPPMPYRRIKPEYTAEANLYDIEATIDILADVDEDGKILRTQITRWAGYGLDESVTQTVKKMNWRPAERNGKTLPMRILLRYNFKNIEDEEN